MSKRDLIHRPGRIQTRSRYGVGVGGSLHVTHGPFVMPRKWGRDPSAAAPLSARKDDCVANTQREQPGTEAANG